MAALTEPILPARYRFTRDLGSGAMGRVVLAEDLKEARQVAVKLLSRQYVGNKEVLSRFVREARIQALLQSPNVVKIFDSNFEGSEPYLVMEFVEGVTLEARLQRTGPLAVADLKRLAREVGGALDLLHGKGILHRDLKPANIMLRKANGSAVVMDLGLASMIDATVLTGTGQLLGTPLYMPPEVLAGKEWSPQGDLFQLGSILYEVGTGQRLYQGKGLDDLVAFIAVGQWEMFGPGTAPIPKPQQDVLRRAVDPDPKRRFPSGRAFGEAFAGGASGAFPRPSGALDAKTMSGSTVIPPAAPAGPRPAMLAVGGALAATLLGLGFFLGGKRQPQDVTLTVVGDTLVVGYRDDGIEGVRLKLDWEEVSPEPEASGGRRRILARGLTPGKEAAVQLVWSGGTGPRESVRGDEPALKGGLRLGAGRTIKVEVVRRCRARWSGSSMPAFDLEPGRQAIPVPPELAESLGLEWEEAGIPFRVVHSLERIFRDEAGRLATAMGDTDPRVELAGVDTGRAVAEERLVEERLVLRELLAWIPDMLDGKLPVEERLKLWDLWRAWSQVVPMLRFKGGQPEDLLLPPERTGAFFQGLPTVKDLESRSANLVPAPTYGRAFEERGIELSSQHGVVLGSRHSEASAYGAFEWPRDVPAAAPRVWVSLWTDRLPQSARLQLGPEAGNLPGWPVHLCHPKPTVPEGTNFAGWASVCLPGFAVPPPGTKLRLTVGSLVGELANLVWAREVRVSWKRAG